MKELGNLRFMTFYPQLASKIIKEQELIIGPIAWDEAGKISGLHVINIKEGEVTIEGDEKEVLTKLVAQYGRLFGRASIEVCKEAVSDLVHQVPAENLPESLRE